ncbi:uncharacterized protein [Rutidosis leptorrhynchoides]|uniref:uncharacterized protein n=1 Tax=Rutidosis leptorrhynchoides TaxID=125765 RepID=UPI003A991BD5
MHSSAFNSKTTNFVNGNNNFTNNKKKYKNPPLKCTNCNMLDHTIERCYELIGYPPDYIKKPFNQGAPRFNSSNCVTEKHDSYATNVQLTSDQIMKLLNLVNEKPVYNQVESNMSGSIQNNNVFFNSQFDKFFCSDIFQNDSKGWIIDSGAYQHMVSNSQNLNKVIDVSNLNLTVNHPNGTVAKILQKRNLRLSDNIELYDVLVIPQYCVSLLSVNKMIKDSNLVVSFDANKCYIQDLIQTRLMGTGSEFDGLYFFDDNSNGKIFKSNMIYSNLSKSKLWHERLGHPAYQALNELSDKLGFNKINNNAEPCETCHKAKQTRDPFPLSDHKTKSLGDLIHLDTWGPYKVKSKEGFRYFLTVIDDFSRAVWTYLLKIKEENGIAERKHRHLLNVARSLMFQGGLPLLPSSVLSSKCPYELIYGKCPNLSHLRIFGCLCFATILNNHDKFSSRALKCVFFGYSNFQKDSVFKTDFAKENVNYQNFFDCFEDSSFNLNQKTELNVIESTESESPNDEGRGSTKDDGNHALLYGSIESQSDGVPAISNDESIETQTVPEGNLTDNVFNCTPQLRRSSRETKLLVKFKDYVLNNNVKYSINDYLNYSRLRSENYYFVTSLTKGHEPESFKEACIDQN